MFSNTETFFNGFQHAGTYYMYTFSSRWYFEKKKLLYKMCIEKQNSANY